MILMNTEFLPSRIKGQKIMKGVLDVDFNRTILYASFYYSV